MREAIHINAQAFLAAAEAETAQAQVPPYASISAPSASSSRSDRSTDPASTNEATLFKPALLEEALGVKVVAVRAGNTQLGLPTVPAVILLSDRLTGYPTALIQATYLTALRTAAGSGVATDLFAQRNATVLAVFGAGMQAHAHVEAVLAVRPSVHTVHIINRSAPRAEELVAALRMQYPAVTFIVHATSSSSTSSSSPSASDAATAAAALSAAIRSAHVLCTTTSSTVPLLHASDVSPGAHINAVGSFLPSMVELAADLVCAPNARIVTDGPAALHAGDLHGPLQSGSLRAEELRQIGCFVDRERSCRPLKDAQGGAEIGFTLRVASPAQRLRTSDEYVCINVCARHCICSRLRAFSLPHERSPHYRVVFPFCARACLCVVCFPFFLVSATSLSSNPSAMPSKTWPPRMQCCNARALKDGASKRSGSETTSRFEGFIQFLPLKNISCWLWKLAKGHAFASLRLSLCRC
jgi:ornithine cyclodeaminase